jgi:predicted AlkP superfamily phosphohydrolase/phosphomutase
MEAIFKFFDPTHIIVMSDHGFHEAERTFFYINTWLEKKGYLKKSRRGYLASLLYNLATSLIQKFNGMRTAIPERVKKYVATGFTGFQVDFSKSKAYASRWGLFISDVIRNTDEYDDFREKLKRELENAIDPVRGEKIFLNINKREELYKGNYINKFPDLIFVPKPEYLINANLSRSIVEPCFTYPYLQGSHKSDCHGIFIAYGNGIKRGQQIEGSRIVDLTPTVLYLCGVPIPRDVDGRVLEEIFETSYLEGNPIKYESFEDQPLKTTYKRRTPFSKKEQEEIIERLRVLGYI